MHHCYLIPYSIINGKIFVLIGKKLCYSSKDGFLHNNPGQWVFIGGGCKKSQDDEKIIKSAIREFVEETGNYVNRNNMILKKYNEFAVSFYRVSTDKEYKKFAKLNPNKDEKYKEIKQLKWIPINDAIKLMDPKSKMNGACDNKLEASVHQYIKDWSKNNWQLKSEMKNFKRFLEGRLNTRLSYPQYQNGTEEIRQNLKRSQNYNLLYDHFIKEFNKRAYTDWYLTMVKYLKSHLKSIDNTIQNSPRNHVRRAPAKRKTPTPLAAKKKSPPKKKSPAKKSPPKKSAAKPKRKFQVRRVAVKMSPQGKQQGSRYNRQQSSKPRQNNRFARN